MSLFSTVLSFRLPPLLSHVPHDVRCVLALTRASTRYTKKKITFAPETTVNLNHAGHCADAMTEDYCAALLRSLVKGDSGFWGAPTKLYFENKCRRLHFVF